jgi:putative endonuclease
MNIVSFFKNFFEKEQKPKKEPTDKQKIGKIGEDATCKFLKDKGYKIIDRNYLKKWGEIDVVAKKGDILHFVEIKTVSRDLEVINGQVELAGVTHGTFDHFRPEDNMHSWKLERLGRVFQSYLLDKNVPDEAEWVFDMVTVYIDVQKGLHKIEILEDLVL